VCCDGRRTDGRSRCGKARSYASVAHRFNTALPSSSSDHLRLSQVQVREAPSRMTPCCECIVATRAIWQDFRPLDVAPARGSCPPQSPGFTAPARPRPGWLTLPLSAVASRCHVAAGEPGQLFREALRPGENPPGDEGLV